MIVAGAWFKGISTNWYLDWDKKFDKIAKGAKNGFGKDIKVGNWGKTKGTAGIIWGPERANCYEAKTTN